MKNPCFNFYPDNFLGGTLLMSRREKGLYIEILCIMYNNGRLSRKQLEAVSGADQDCLDIILEKFEIDEQGKYFSPRLEQEIEKKNKKIIHAKKAAAARWGNADANADASAQDMPSYMNSDSMNNDIRNREIGGPGGKRDIRSRVESDYTFTELMERGGIPSDQFDYFREQFIDFLESDMKNNWNHSTPNQLRSRGKRFFASCGERLKKESKKPSRKDRFDPIKNAQSMNLNKIIEHADRQTK